MTAPIQHLPAGVEQKAPSPPPALNLHATPSTESVQNLFCQDKGTPPNQPNCLSCHLKSRAAATMGFLRSVVLPRAHVLTPEHTTDHMEPFTTGLSPHSHQPLLLITPPAPKSPEAVLGDAWRKVLKATHRSVSTSHTSAFKGTTP